MCGHMRARTGDRRAALVLAAGLAACSGSSTKSGPPADDAHSFTLFVTTELRGTIEPCGCTSDPLGDLARTAALIARARTGKDAVLYVDGGSTLYQDSTIPPHLATQETLKGDLLAAALTGPLAAGAVGLGPNDLARGAAAVAPPRQAANVDPGAGVPLAPPRVIEVGGVPVGVFGVVAPDAIAALGVHAGDPAEAARTAIAGLRGQGARVVVGLLYMTKKDAIKLARAAPGIDVVVVGQGAPEPADVSDAPSQVGTSWLVQPANRGQVVTRLDITVRGDGPLVDAIGEARAHASIARLDQRIAELDTQLAGWEKDPGADPEFVATKKQELADARAERAGLADHPLRVPDQGNWFQMQQVRIARGLPCDAAVQADKQAYDRKVGEANQKAAAGTRPPAPPAGQPSYVGGSCGDTCHDEQIAFWKQTRHHQAWNTLVEVGKQYNFDCIGCHVTAWEQPGGSNLGNVADFQDVGCETCHGPGSAHENAPKKVELRSEAPKELCLHCHTAEHSDTFDYTAYLRDVTGPDHAPKFRKVLGDGPTGHELRKAALERAGKEVGAGCAK